MIHRQNLTLSFSLLRPQRIGVGSALSSNFLALQQLIDQNRFEVCTVNIDSDHQRNHKNFGNFSRALSGNKALKLYHFYQTYQDRYSHVKRVVTHGGNFSNAMYAIHQLCLDHDWQLIYYTNEVDVQSSYWGTGGDGGSLLADSTFYKVFGMNHGGSRLGKEEITAQWRHISQFESDLEKEHSKRSDTLVIERGGASPVAQTGVDLLARFLHDEIVKASDDTSSSSVVNILLPSGTGTTCLFLAKYFFDSQRQSLGGSPNVKVWTVPCVGRIPYLYDQMQAVCPSTERSWLESNIHCMESKSKFRRFAQPHVQLYELWKQLVDVYGVEFDLIYAPKTLVTFVDRLQEQPELSKQRWIYIHTGGEAGNPSQLERYRKLRMRQ